MELVEQIPGGGQHIEVRAKVKAQELPPGSSWMPLDRKGCVEGSLPAVIWISTAPRTRTSGLHQEGESARALRSTIADRDAGVKPRGHAAVTRHNAAWRFVPTPGARRRIQGAISKGEHGCLQRRCCAGAAGSEWLERRIRHRDRFGYTARRCWEGR